jgi:hypothetical protein
MNTKRYVGIISGIFLLAGCADTPTAPGVVKEAVYMPCDAPVPALPVFPADTLTGDEDIFTLGKTLWADRKARQAYELKVRTALEGCTARVGP